jgi:hypothetical protein
MSQPRPPTPEGCPEPYGDCSCSCHFMPGTMHIMACCAPEAPIQHVPTCAVGSAQPCSSDQSLHGEAVGEHWWSGWPGAMCLKCGSEDPREVCLAGCVCPCHEGEFPPVDEG